MDSTGLFPGRQWVGISPSECSDSSLEPSESEARASRADRPMAARTAAVAMAVEIGKRQNSQTMVDEDRASRPMSTTRLVRKCVVLVIPAAPKILTQITLSFQQGCYSRPAPVRKCGKALKAFAGLPVGYQPSMISRRQCRAVKTINRAANPSEDAAEIAKSPAPRGSSRSTLVMSRCWLREGMNIREVLVFRE